MSSYKSIPSFDLTRQYSLLQTEIKEAVEKVFSEGTFIKGPEVDLFETELASYFNYQEVVSCGNGTDALQIALMTLGLKPGDEVLVPSFTYPATAEVIALLGLVPRFVEVEEDSFCVSARTLEPCITSHTVAIIVVHLYGQSAPMEEILALAKANSLYVIEDNAQALGTVYSFSNGTTSYTGAMADIGCTSFFPTKNLGGYGDGGALTFGTFSSLGQEGILRSRQIASHGQREKYFHQYIGCNSRLDTLQAAILRVKLRHLKEFIAKKQHTAFMYDTLLTNINALELPYRSPWSTHTFYQYTLKVKDGQRDCLQNYLKSKGINTMIYYPRAVHLQPAFNRWKRHSDSFELTERLGKEILSLPIFPEITEEEVIYIADTIKAFFIK